MTAGEAANANGYKLASGDGESIGAIGISITLKADSATTSGAHSLFEYAVPPRCERTTGAHPQPRRRIVRDARRPGGGAPG
jgi:hypothetical protein